MLKITNTIAVDEHELTYSFIRASGPGGQHVNKAATAVQLRFDVAHSPSLPDDVRARLIELAGKQINKEGVLIIDARRYRTHHLVGGYPGSGRQPDLLHHHYGERWWLYRWRYIQCRYHVMGLSDRLCGWIAFRVSEPPDAPADQC